VSRTASGLIALLLLSGHATAQPLLERLPDAPSEPLPLSAPGLASLSATSPPLNLEQVEELAWAHNPTLRQAQEQIEGTLGKALQAGLWPNPTIGYVAEQIGVEGTAGEFQGAFV
jgi:outer membrane protein, heavy metal efflux system